MHSFEVYSNESACRKSGRLGMDQVMSLFYYHIIFTKIWHGVVIGLFVVHKTSFLSHLNSCPNLLDPSIKIQTMIRVEIYSNKGICIYFCINILNEYIDNYDDLPLVDPYMNFLPHHYQDLPCD